MRHPTTPVRAVGSALRRYGGGGRRRPPHMGRARRPHTRHCTRTDATGSRSRQSRGTGRHQPCRVRGGRTRLPAGGARLHTPQEQLDALGDHHRAHRRVHVRGGDRRPGGATGGGGCRSPRHRPRPRLRHLGRPTIALRRCPLRWVAGRSRTHRARPGAPKGSYRAIWDNAPLRSPSPGVPPWPN